MALQVSITDTLILALEDIVNPSICYAILLPFVMWVARSVPEFCAAASSLAAALLLVSLLPGIVENFPVYVLSTLALLGLCFVHLRELRQQHDSSSETRIVLTVLACILFLFSLIVLNFTSITRSHVGGVRPLLAAIAFLLACRWWMPRFKKREGMRVVRFIVFAGVLVLCGRAFLWVGQFHTVSSPSTHQANLFPNIRRLHAVQKGLSQLHKGQLAKAVGSFRTVLLGMDPDTVPFRVACWTKLDRDSLPMILAFGGPIPLTEGTLAVSFSWDHVNQRLLILSEDGHLLAITLSGPSDLGTPLPDAVAVAVSRDGSRIGLLSAKGRIYVTDRDGRERWKLWLSKDTYRDLAATDLPNRFLALRADGGVFNVTDKGSRLLGGYRTWPDTQPAVSIAATSDGKGYYVLTRFGGVHPREQTAIRYPDLRGHANSRHFWSGQDVARAIDLLRPEAYPVYLDRYGGLHAVVRIADQVSFRGNDYPPLSDPVAVDLAVGIVPHMFHILCEDGTIMPIPDRGWLFPTSEKS